MEAFNFLVNGWVTNTVIVSCHRPKVFILMQLVKHSQQLPVPAVTVWVVTKSDDEVMSAHCSCMAGLLSHCSWLPPSFRSVPLAEIAQIDFHLL